MHTRVHTCIHAYILFRPLQENVLQAVEDIKKEVEEDDEIPALDGGPRKLIVLVCNAAPKVHFHSLLEGGYRFFNFLMLIFLQYVDFHCV